VFGHRLADIGEGGPEPDVAARETRCGADDRDAFARVVGAAPCRVAPMVRGEDKKILGLEGRKE